VKLEPVDFNRARRVRPCRYRFDVMRRVAAARALVTLTSARQPMSLSCGDGL